MKRESHPEYPAPALDDSVRSRVLTHLQAEARRGERPAPARRRLRPALAWAAMAAVTVALLTGGVVLRVYRGEGWGLLNPLAGSPAPSEAADTPTTDRPDLPYPLFFDVPEGLTGLPVEHYWLSDTMSDTSTAMKIEQTALLAARIHSVALVEVTGVTQSAPYSANDPAQTAQVKLLGQVGMETLSAYTLPSVFSVTQWPGDQLWESPSLLREGQKYILPLGAPASVASGDPVLLGDTNLLFEVDEAGLAWSHSGYPAFNAYDGRSYMEVMEAWAGGALLAAVAAPKDTWLFSFNEPRYAEGEIPGLPGGRYFVGRAPLDGPSEASPENGQWLNVLYLTYDDGQTWFETGDTNGLWNGELACAAFADRDIGYLYFRAAAFADEGVGRVYRTVDGGQTWALFQPRMDFTPDEEALCAEAQSLTFDEAGVGRMTYRTQRIPPADPRSYAYTAADTTYALISLDSGASWQLAEGYAPYQYAASLKGNPGALVWDTGRRVLLLGPDLVLYEYDPVTDKAAVFCQVPGCGHQNDACAAGNAVGNLEAVDGVVAMLRGRDSGGSGSWLSVLKDGVFSFLAAPVLKFRIGPDGFYALRPDWSLVRVPFSGGEPELIAAEFRADNLLLMGGYMYGAGAEGLVRVSLSDGVQETVWADTTSYSTDGQYLYVGQGDGVTRTDMNGENPVAVIGEPDVWPISLCFDGDYIYYRRFAFAAGDASADGEVYRIPKDLSVPAEKLGKVDGDIIALPSLPGVLLVCNYTDLRYQLFDTNTGAVRDIALP
ncbi:MAG: hypothetical protein LBT60_06925 [Oscillospiraceae bacterium]|jgi:hypothetical protein|nr:hypothetical protein [Oscillospiraceae bacterium]